MDINRLSWGLARVAAGEAEDLFEKLGISFASLLPESQIVLNDPLDNGFVQVVGKLVPGRVWICVANRVTAADGERRKCTISQGLVLNAAGGDILPETVFK